MKVSKYFKGLLVLVLSITSISIFGQARVTVRQNGANTELYFNKAVKAPTYNEVVGSPYLYEEFVPAKVNDIDMTLFVRFNLYDDSIEFKGEDGKVYTMPKSNEYIIKLLNGSNKIFETHGFKDAEGEIGYTFFEKVYSDDDFGFYIKDILLYTPVKLAKNSFETNKPAKFKKGIADFYYLNYDAETLGVVKIPKREKQFLKIFEEHSSEVKDFIKKEGLDLKETKDLIRILQFYFNQ